ncbi:MAG: T9SS type A sorting domain-containing protein [Bacteroidales bacterium]|jgi:plastocyanin
MKTFILISLFVFLSLAGFSTKWTVVNSGFTFSPATLTVNTTDSIQFNLANIHNAIEVSQATWNADGNTPLPGGFSLPFGGGLLLASSLSDGIHYYVCSVHASMGMKGTITVESSAGIAENPGLKKLSVYPNPANNSITISIGTDLIGSNFIIADQTGKFVTSGKLITGITTIPVDQLSSGIYFFEVAGQKANTVKFIKE